MPNSAVRRGAPNGVATTFVYLVNADNTVSVRPVTLGVVDGERVAVTAGLKAGESRGHGRRRPPARRRSDDTARAPLRPRGLRARPAQRAPARQDPARRLPAKRERPAPDARGRAPSRRNDAGGQRAHGLVAIA